MIRPNTKHDRLAEEPAADRGRRRSTILMLGFRRLAEPFVGRLADDELSFLYGRASALRVPFCNLVYQIGGGPVVDANVFGVCKALQRRIVKHWIGSDVLRAREPLVQEQNATGLVEHWAVASHLVDELAEAGIAASTVPLSVVDAVPSIPLPPPPLTILSYLPSRKFEFYSGSTVLSLASRFPDVHFIVVGDDGVDRGASKNVEFLGYQRQIDVVYARSHALLRLPRHDGLSYMVLEALNHGRQVIWNLPFETVRMGRTENEVACHIRELRAAVTAGTLALNTRGRDVVHATHSGARVRDIIRTKLKATIGDDRRRGNAL
jgi:glycosyltransferase involved in cell wall biosynthesis